jgi:molecular chaperone DnaK
VAALILAELRRMAESALGGTVSEAVITVPAWYDSAQRHAVRDAAGIAGLAVRRLLSEPTAAALGHGAHLGRGGRHLICDLGGGTFDVSVVDIDGGVFEVLATAGDALLGGDDFDAAAVMEVVADVRARFGVELTDEPVRLDRLRQAARRAKHELSGVAATSFYEAALAPLPSGRPLDYARPIARTELEAWSAPLLARLDGPCRDALRRAGCGAGEIDEVLLVGGMTRMPAVQARLAQVLGRPPRQVDNPDEVVAVGAAIAVARLAGEIEGVLLIDACPRGVALSYDGGPCEVVIPPGVVVPIREARVLATRRAGQRALEFDIWEGESPDPTHNRHLARYVVTDVPEAAAGDAMIVVELTVDTDGVVGVSARELISGERPPLGALVSIGMPRAEMEALRAQLGSDLSQTVT